ncbi:MAG TPA: hypothetical protein PKL84_09330 [Candidatus Hydrogenedentes bacterium]|nr:hypothetical protein [Candidatus Hydrogenedentota bacterium]
MRHKTVLLVIAVLVAAPAGAQGPGGLGPGPGGPPERMGAGPGGPPEGAGLRRGWQDEAGPLGPEVRELLEQVFVARLSRRLKLDDGQTVLMVRHYMDHREKIQALREERMRLIEPLQRLAEENVNEAETMTLLEKIVAVDRELALARFAVFEEMSKSLTPAQKAGLYLFVSDFENELRRWMTQVHRRRFEEGHPPLSEPGSLLDPEMPPPAGGPAFDPEFQPPPPPDGPRMRDGELPRRPGPRGQGRGPMQQRPVPETGEPAPPPPQ